jgi:hypothetical protein
MDKVISDCDKAENSNCVKHILCAISVSYWFSETCPENQNFAENRYGTLKATANSVMNFSGAPENTFLLALM